MTKRMGQAFSGSFGKISSVHQTHREAFYVLAYSCAFTFTPPCLEVEDQGEETIRLRATLHGYVVVWKDDDRNAFRYESSMYRKVKVGSAP
jgi:hypothetical protein